MIKINYPQSNEILFLRGDINYTEFHLIDGKKVVSSFTLLRHQEKLDGFLRVSRKYLVNPKYISEIENINGTKNIYMETGEKIPVARRRKTYLVELYEKK
ncbi:MAG TPA: LytTR family transcriptional regulator DNA-binding domain-containing protein [Leadbetterella sp.]|nr:LytTR family transcriptional regulator DNA-binding domain-containing protein [Leadbetterella sp.]